MYDKIDSRFFQVLKIRKVQNPSNLREAFWRLGGRPERPKEALGEPKETQRGALEPQRITPEGQIVDFIK